MFLVSFFVIFLRLSCAVSNVVNKEKWLECLCLTFQPLRISSSISVRDDYALQYSIFFLHNPESQYVGFGCPGIWGEHVTISLKAICTLKSNAIRYVNSLFLHCCNYNCSQNRLQSYNLSFISPNSQQTNFQPIFFYILCI